MRVLIVEDDKALADGLTRTLRQSGYAVDHAETGELALRACAEEHYDLVVLDISLPGVDGFEVLQRLRRDPATRDIPVIMLTAKASDADVFMGWQSGVDCYLTKPFHPLELLRFVARILEAQEEIDWRAGRRVERWVSKNLRKGSQADTDLCNGLFDT